MAANLSRTLLTPVKKKKGPCRGLDGFDGRSSGYRLGCCVSLQRQMRITS